MNTSTLDLPLAPPELDPDALAHRARTAKTARRSLGEASTHVL